MGLVKQEERTLLGGRAFHVIKSDGLSTICREMRGALTDAIIRFGAVSCEYGYHSVKSLVILYEGVPKALKVQS